MLERNVHVEVLNGDIHLTESLLVLLTTGIQLVEHFLKKSDLLCILSDAVLVPISRSEIVSLCNEQEGRKLTCLLERVWQPLWRQDHPDLT